MERPMTQARGFAVAAFLSIFVAACNVPPREDVAAISDEQFVKLAGEGGLAEVELGRMARQKAADPAVRNFANQMVSGHDRVNQQLMQIAQSEGISPPRTVGPEHEQVSRDLASLSGTDFDRRYMEVQIAEHERAIDLYQDQARAGESKSLQGFAEEKLPALEAHLQRAQAVADRLGS